MHKHVFTCLHVYVREEEEAFFHSIYSFLSYQMTTFFDVDNTNSQKTCPGFNIVLTDNLILCNKFLCLCRRLHSPRLVCMRASL